MLLKEGNYIFIFSIHVCFIDLIEGGTCDKCFAHGCRFSGTIIALGSMSTSPWTDSEWRSLKVLKILGFCRQNLISVCTSHCFLNIYSCIVMFSSIVEDLNHMPTSDRSNGTSLLLFPVQIEFHHGNWNHLLQPIYSHLNLLQEISVHDLLLHLQLLQDTLQFLVCIF